MYNGQFQNVSVPVGTIFTGISGIEVAIDQDTTLPAANPPSFGQITISAHAIDAGSRGNIPADDINQGCCATAIKAVNTNAFYGGQDERTYTTVTQKDINKVSTVVKTTLAHSIAGALQGQLNLNEQLQILHCSPTVISDHAIGAEATQVKVIVSQTCSAVAYNSQELQTKATSFLATQAQHKTGTGYSIFGTVQVTVKQATVSSTPPHLVFLSFKASGTWIYGISHSSQEHIKHLLAGKTTQEAQNLLASLPGIEHASIRLSGFGDATTLPKTTGYMHVTIFVV